MPKPTIAELMAYKKLEKGPAARDIKGLVTVLRKLADDIEKGKAVEMDFDLDLESFAIFDYMKITLETYHLRPENVKVAKIGDGK